MARAAHEQPVPAPTAVGFAPFIYHLHRLQPELSQATRPHAPGHRLCHALWWLERGAIHVRDGAAIRRWSGPQLLLVPPGALHRCEAGASALVAVFDIAAQLQPRSRHQDETQVWQIVEPRPAEPDFASVLGVTAPMAIDPGWHDSAQRLLLALADDYWRSDFAHASANLRLGAWLLAWLASVDGRSDCRRHRGTGRFDQARDALRRELGAGRSISMAELARLAGCSAGRFARRFRALYGQSPRAYLDGLRQERAEALLLDRAQPIESIGRALGFSGASAFGRWFRACTGIAPTAWRAAGPLAAPLREGGEAGRAGRKPSFPGQPAASYPPPPPGAHPHPIQELP